jgi:hypothetical protein
LHEKDAPSEGYSQRIGPARKPSIAQC